MCVINEFLGKECMNEGLNRGRCRAAVKQARADLVFHYIVGQRRERAQPLQPAKVKPRMAFRLNQSHIEARRFNENGGNLLASDIREGALYGAIAAPMQHERGLLT
jgi:hypothetical protein